MTKPIGPRARKVRVLATLGPASNTPEMIAALFQAGADAFRVNMSHGDQASKVAVIQAIRSLEKKFGRPSTILADLQGPKLRVGKFEGGRTTLVTGNTFVLDRSAEPGDDTRVELPHREIFEAIEPGARLLLDDGKLVLRVIEHEADRIVTIVEVGGAAVEQQGAERSRRGGADGGADGEGSQRPRLCRRAGGGLDCALLRPASRGPRGGAQADRRQGGAARQDREARGDRPAGGDRRGVRRRNGGARRPGSRAAATGGAAAPEAHRRGVRAGSGARWSWRRRCSNR